MLDPIVLKTLEINETVAREALAQSERRLADLIEEKKSGEAKATTFFATYVTISIAVFGIGATLARDHSFSTVAWPFFVAGAVFMSGAILAGFVVVPGDFGFAGSTPKMWLINGTINAKDEDIGLILAYIVHAYQERIDRSWTANKAKGARLKATMAVGVFGAAIFAASLLHAFKIIG
jgi:uncharacterized membrane protein YgdD (TMEM256/DUF423 family)